MSQPSVQALVLDAGPLLSLAPLRGLSQSYYTVPQVLGELKDEKAQSHFQNLGLSAGVKVEVRVPDANALAQVILAAKKSGDYAVLSSADLHVIALTYALHQEHEAKKSKEQEQKASDTILTADNTANEDIQNVETNHTEEQTIEQNEPAPAAEPEESSNEEDEIDKLAEEFERVPLDVTTESKAPASKPSVDPTPEEAEEPLYEDPSSEDDGQGEWITPGNVALHKSRALDLLPGSNKSKKRKAKEEPVEVGCMTADFAMQNLCMHMGLNLVGVEGTRIRSVKSWVLRCHACFKICKDSSKKFCPSCGNNTLLRTSITTTAPTKPGEKPTVQIHLKPNFQYRTRGTKYSIPLPKPGTSKTGSGSIILREDQREYQRAVEKEQKKEERDHARLMKATLGADGKDAGSVKVGNWSDPDWVPGMLLGTDRRRDNGGLPTIGMGKKNPNERRRRK